ncbi:MAG TPA: CDP-alcohol phosphatidyltransferase family protein [Acidothermaceae bacterium]
MSPVRLGPSIGLLTQVMLLVALACTVGLTVSGWLLGIACGIATNVALARGLDRYGTNALGPADRVTLVRATLVGAAAALTADAFVRPVTAPTLVTLSVVALVLDAVDGWVARRTGTVSPLGARFDGEVDALLILVLSVYVSNLIGPWALAIGAARYLFLVAGWLVPWMRAPLPPRYWRKTVAAIEGITLTVAAADVLPRRLAEVVLVVALGLLTESFGRDVWWLRRESVRSPVNAQGRSIAASVMRH